MSPEKKAKDKKKTTAATATPKPNPFSSEEIAEAMLGPDPHLHEIKSLMQSLNLRPQHPPEKVREMHERLGAWLATATPQDIHILAAWKDRPDWDGPHDPLALGIQLEVFDQAVRRAARAMPAGSMPTPEKLARATHPDNLRAILKKMPRAALVKAIAAGQMGTHEKETVRKRIERQFGATRKKAGRPPERK